MEIFNSINNIPWNQKMKLMRQINGWTQQQAAEKCTTNQKMYWSWEKGINYPRPRSRNYIARAFKTKVDDIFSNKIQEARYGCK
ncbi:MAG: helix-turn-helix transcriptional regulator [Solirubrobacterales bacterium]